MHIKQLAGFIALAMTALPVFALDLYVDSQTKQIYAEPGPNRIKLGTFERVEDKDTAQASTPAHATVEEYEQRISQKTRELKALETRLDNKVKEIASLEKKSSDKGQSNLKLSEKGLEFDSGDGNFKARLGGRLQVDSQVNFTESAAPKQARLADDLGFRRARIYTEGTLFQDYDYRFEYDWARNGGGTQGITDAYVKYTHFKPFGLTIGQMNEGKSLESSMSNNYLTFIERPLPHNALIEAGPASKYQMGIIADTYGTLYEHPYTLRGGITTEPIGAPAPGNSSNNSQGGINRNAFSGDIGHQWVGRATFLPYKDGSGNLLHTGAWGSWRSINNHYNPDGSYRNGGWDFVSQPDTNMDRTNWMHTGNLTATSCVATDASGQCTGYAASREVSNIAMFGAELGGVMGPTHFTAEYMQANISGKGYGSNDELRGYSAYAGWFLTGESRPYDEKKGVWGRLTPKSNFIAGHGWGAWELAARYDLMDMNTPNIKGGSVNAGTLALNWYLNSRIRLMTNWVRVLNTSTAQAGKCTAPTAGSNPGIACFDGLSPDIWETAVRLDF